MNVQDASTTLGLSPTELDELRSRLGHRDAALSTICDELTHQLYAPKDAVLDAFAYEAGVDAHFAPLLSAALESGSFTELADHVCTPTPARHVHSLVAEFRHDQPASKSVGIAPTDRESAVDERACADGESPVDARSWLLRLGAEVPSPTLGCTLAECRHDRVSPLDLYCDTHDRFLPGLRKGDRWTRRITTSAALSATFAAFSLTAQTHRWVPMALLYACLAAAVLVLPLRRLPMTRRVAKMAVLAAFVIATGVLALPSRYLPVVGTLTVAGVALFWFAHVTRVTVTHGSSGIVGRRRLREVLRKESPETDLPVEWVAASLATTPLLVALALTARSHRGWLLGIPRSWDAWLLALSFGALTGGIALAAVVSVFQSSSSAHRFVKPLLGIPARPQAVRRQVILARRDRAPGLVGSIQAIVAEFAARVAISTVKVACIVANTTLAAIWVVFCMAVRVINYLHQRLVIFARYVIDTLKGTGRLLAQAAAVAARSTLRTVRIAGLPLAAVAAATVLLSLAATRTAQYLATGGVGDILAVAGCWAASLAVLTVAWFCWSGRGLHEVRQSASHSIRVALPQLLVLLTLGGWVVGLPGTLGHGVIHVGAFTLAMTAIVGAIVAFGAMSPEGRQRFELLSRPASDETA
ncbi:MAG TPA: hypothetical protein VGQ42_13475 [Candidatus Dormibacteraeota bacterium]|jgi:hypothetical protein|nr:hypothetical protein [Candidatus Dormibacteraeota bacterium]